ncbi:hypothetical protein GCM10022220_28470 [Actinocatenispora rupis]|uniref:histidine kinase n=2 Tax=Actinocatenispora rupis TaxID=519421 RepID=A0A8J3N9P4_9ACTN|nr:hypothetical protein Aru02nite_24130 [Actinocatenispora rupis]
MLPVRALPLPLAKGAQNVGVSPKFTATMRGRAITMATLVTIWLFIVLGVAIWIAFRAHLSTIGWTLVFVGFPVTLAIDLVWITQAPRHVITSLRKLAILAENLAAALNDSIERLHRREPVADTLPVEFSGWTMDEFGQLGRRLHDGTQANLSTMIQAMRGETQSRVGIKIARRSSEINRRALDLLYHFPDMDSLTADQAHALDQIDKALVEWRRYNDTVLFMSDEPLPRVMPEPESLETALRAAEEESTLPPGDDRIDIIVPRDVHTVAVGPEIYLHLVHLLTELLNNSIRSTRQGQKAAIKVRATDEGTFVKITIEDLGEGFPDGADGDRVIRANNEKIARAPHLSTFDPDHTGLDLVGRIAGRLGIGVTLGRSPYGGALVDVTIPKTVLDTRAATPPTEPPGPRLAVVPDIGWPQPRP